MKTVLDIGIDVGSTTVKAVAMDQGGAVVWKDYRRHAARQAECVRDFLARIAEAHPEAVLRTYVTGSGGRAIAPHIGASYIQEVNAVTLAIERLLPDTRSVIELGGQDAKVILWKTDRDGRRTTLTYMNDKCAGGTGATIDRILAKIGVPPARVAALRHAGTSIHHVAAKCGVFAETDVVGLAKGGVSEDEMIVSLLVAIVKQNLEVLVRGNILGDRVVLLGGPQAFIPALAEIWRATIPDLWKLQGHVPASRPIEELVWVPPDAEYYPARGAVVFGKESEAMQGRPGREAGRGTRRYEGLERLDAYIEKGRLEQLMAYGAVREGLVRDEPELTRFRLEYSPPPFVPPALKPGEAIRCHVGIDGGSTSSKLAVVDLEGRLVYKDYILSRGNPISDVSGMFASLGEWLECQGATLEVLGMAVTGYAADIVAEAFRADVRIVETIAHMRAAVHHHGDVDVVCDIGGQDIKILFLRNGKVVDFRLNTQCSAGNGYFLQSMADQFGIPVGEYADRAFRARLCPSFNCGCAVFMEQDKVNFQQLGWSKEEIMAGLARVLPLNIWHYVVQEPNLARFGRRFVLQGGTQRNLAAVKAQVDYIRSKIPDAIVHVHEHADVCGALGAALEAQRQMAGRATAFPGIAASAAVRFETRNDASTRCRFCTNRCPRTFVDIGIPGGSTVRFISGNGCDKGKAETTEEMKSRERRLREIGERVPNLAALANDLVFARWDPADVEGRPGPTDRGAPELRARTIVGIPRLLNLFAFAPFWNAYFRALGVGDVVYSDPTSQQLWETGNKFGAIDPCFPAKVGPAHVYNLLGNERVTHICFPIVTHLDTHLLDTLGNNACVIQMGTPEVVHAAFSRGKDHFRERSMEYWKPLVRMDRPEAACGQLLEFFRDRLRVGEAENRWAVGHGYDALRRYLAELRARGREVIDWLVENDRIGIVVLGHPYHHDPGLNHGLLSEFQRLGTPILCIESLPVDDEFLAPLFGVDHARSVKDVWIRNFNRNTNHKIWAAKVVARHPNLAAIDLSSFKCGHDAPTYSYVDSIMDTSGAPHFLFHDIDQNKPHASMKIRIQTADYFMRLEEATLAARVKGHDDAA